MLSTGSYPPARLRSVQPVAWLVSSRGDPGKTIQNSTSHVAQDYISLLQHTYFVQVVEAYSASMDRVVAQQPKLYLADTGILNRLAQVSSGAVFENAIAVQLRQAGAVTYYQTARQTAEIDFILDGQHGYEVKETPTAHDLAVLQHRSSSAKVNQATLIGRYFPASGFRDFVWGGNVYSHPTPVG